MNRKEELFEEFCHICGKLVAIAEFPPGTRRSKTRVYICSWCDQGDSSYWKKPRVVPMLTNSDIDAKMKELQTQMNDLYKVIAINKDTINDGPINH